MKRHIVLLMIALILTACSNSIQDKENNETSNVGKSDDISTNNAAESDKQQLSITKSEDEIFRVISAYELVEKYVQEAEEVDKNNHYELWQETVINDIREDCFSGVYSHIVEDYITSPPASLQSTDSYIEELNTSDVENTIIEALEASAKEFPGPETTVCLLPQDDEIYFSGVNVDAGKISVFYSGILRGSLLNSVIAHEYHHSTWTEKYSDDYKWDLLGAIIFEGKAEYFASLLFGKPNVHLNLHKKHEKRLWEKVKNSLDSTDPETVNTILYGGKDDIPQSYGYFLGYQIVQEYVERHPELTVDEWSQLSPEEIYKNSGYGDSF